MTSHRAPPTTRRVASLAALVGIAALATTNVAVAGAALVGGLLAVSLSLADTDRPGRLAVGCALAGVAAPTGSGVALAAGTPPLVSILVAVLAAFGALFGLTAGRGTLSVERAAPASDAVLGVLFGAIGLTALAMVATSPVGWIAIDQLLGRHASALRPGTLLALVAAAFLAVNLAASLVPAAAVAPPDRREERAEQLDELADRAGRRGLQTLAVALLLGLLFTTLPSGGSGGLFGRITTWTPGRALLLAAIGASVLAALVGVALRWTWQEQERVAARLALASGVAAALLALALGSLLAGPAAETLLWQAASASAAAWVLLRIGLTTVRWTGGTAVAARAGATAIVSGGVVAALDGAVVVPIVAVAAGFVLLDAGRYGAAFAVEIGSDVPRTDGELVHAGGTVLVAVVSLAVAVPVAVGTTAISPVVDYTVFVGLLVVMVAVGLLAWLLDA